MPLSVIERKILNSVQQDLPLAQEPFSILSQRLGLEQEEFLRKLKALKEKGIIRNFSAGINHRKLGFKSSLVALKVPLKKLDSLAKRIILYPEVTHCFLRQNEYNLWLVFIYKNGMLKDFLNKLTKQVGRENILNLPTQKQFKLKTTLKL